MYLTTIPAIIFNECVITMTMMMMMMMMMMATWMWICTSCNKQEPAAEIQQYTRTHVYVYHGVWVLLYLARGYIILGFPLPPGGGLHSFLYIIPLILLCSPICITRAVDLDTQQHRRISVLSLRFLHSVNNENKLPYCIWCNLSQNRAKCRGSESKIHMSMTCHL